MAATKYFEARNDDQVCIIDDTFKNFGLKELIPITGYKIQVEWQLAGYDASTLNTIYTGVSYLQVNISPFNQENLLAISCDVDDLSYATYAHDDILTIMIIKKGSGDDHNKKDAEYAAQHTRIYHYVPSERISRDEGAGLKIFNAKGEVVFNSSHRYLKVVDAITQDIDDISDINRTYDFNIAVVPLSCRYTATYNPQIVNYYRHFFRIMNGKVLKMAHVIVSAFPPQSYVVLTGFFYNTNLLVIKKDGI